MMTLPDDPALRQLEVLKEENARLKHELQEFKKKYVTIEKADTNQIVSQQYPEEIKLGQGVITETELYEYITKHQRAEQALKESEERFSRAFRSNPNALALSYLKDGIIIDVNDTYISTFGWSREEVIGKSSLSFNILDDPSERDNVVALLKKEGRLIDYEISLKRRSGERITVLMSVELLQTSQGELLLTTIQDVTHLKQIEKTLRKSEEQYRQLVESANSIILRWDINGILSFVNEYTLRYFGYTREEMIGQDVMMLVPDKESSGRDLTNLVRDIVENPSKYEQFENENILKNGERVWVSWANRAITDENGTVIEVLAIGNDITKLKKAEETLKIERDKLEAIIENMGVGVAVTNNQGELLSFNKAALNIHGFESNEDLFLRKDKFYKDFELQYLDGRKMHIQEWPTLRAMRGEFVKDYGAVLIRRRDNTSRYVNYNVSPIYDSMGALKFIVYNTTDVTDIHKANEALRESELRYNKLFNNETNAIAHNRIITDEQGNPVDFEILQINEAYTKMTGIKKEEIEGRKGRDVFPGIEKRSFDYIGKYGKIALEGGEMNFESFNENLGLWFQVYVYSPQKGEFTAIFSDITGRKRIEQEALTRATEIEAILSCIPDGVIVYDTDVNIIRANAAADTILKYPEKDKRKHVSERVKRHFKVWTEDGRMLKPEEMPAYRAAAKGETVTSEVLLLEGHGQAQWLIFNAAPLIVSGKHIGGVLSMLDITNRKRIENKLIRERELFEGIFNNIPVMVTIFDPDLRKFTFNKEMKHILGWTEEDALDGNFMAKVYPDSAYRTQVSDFMKSLEPGWREWRVTAKDGTTVDSLWANIFLSGGVSLGIGIDLRERKAVLEKLRESEERFRLLATTLQQQNIELQKAKEKAEESDKFKSAFIANISHEIRTPMSGILGFADLLKMPDISIESQATYIEAIIASGKRMLSIINDLINISKIEVGQVEIQVEATDINKLLAELFIFFLPEAEKKNIVLKITNELPSGKSFVETDKTKLSQVIINLLKNAIKFTSNGFIEFGCELRDEYYLFYIKDTGAGIRKEDLERIFERFKQGDVTDTGVQEGVGLGLAISKAYVQVLGGTIWVESAPSKGSAFYFTIPYIEPAVKTITPDKKREETNEIIPDIEVLIAEDEEFIYFYLSELLRLNNIKSHHATNGLEAIKIVNANPNIRLIFMDGRMPLMNGIEATRKIKQMKPEIPIIALSALANDTDIQDALAAGCDDYITKPIDKKLLLSKIASYVGAR